jgi:GT2 family glycosyltransferase
MMDLVISIGTIDRYDMLANCLRSIYGDETLDLQVKVVIVINGAPDETMAQRIKENFPACAILQHPSPLGFCRMHNLVMSQSQSRYVLLLDDDTILSKGSLKRMISFMDQNPRVGIASCRTVHPDGEFQKTYGLMPTVKTEFLNAIKVSSFWPDALYDDSPTPKDVDWLNGHFMLVRSDVIAKVGGLDDYYYTYVCEPDWCYRIRKAGWRVVYVPDITIIHACGSHSIYTRSRKYIDIVRAHVNRYYFFHKHYSAVECFLLRPIMVIGGLIRVAYYSVLYVSNADARQEATTRIKGFWGVVRLSCMSQPFVLPKQGHS